MPRLRKILLADNRDSYRDTCVQFLELRGYQAQGVASPEACERALEESAPHLVILDLRMREDEDEQDLSGLVLAKRLPGRLPKLILTAFPTWETTREALTATLGGLPPAAYLVSKLEGLDVLERYVERAFAEHVRLNWDLQLDWPASARAELAGWLEPALTEAQQAGRATECEDLLGRLFLNAEQVKVDRVLWRQPGLAALQVFVAAHGSAPEPLLVVCGLLELVRQEATNYRALAQHLTPATQPAHQAELAETLHFAANAYTLGGVRHSGATTLRELFEVGAGTTAGLRIDHSNQLAWVAGRLLKLTAQEFQLLVFLYERRNQLCTRQQIIEEFFAHRAYDPLDPSQATLVNTNISRLRMELEAEVEPQHYLKTVRGSGYRLEVSE